MKPQREVQEQILRDLRVMLRWAVLDDVEIITRFGSNPRLLQVRKGGEIVFSATVRGREAALPPPRLVLGADLDGIRLQVTNLRTGKTFALDLWFESGGREQIAAWQSEITDYMQALDTMTEYGRRPARPGVGCLGCSYSLGCDAKSIETDHISMAKRLAKLEGERAQLIKALKAATAESAITFDGTTVGYQVTASRTPKPGALTLMWLAWTAANGDVSGLLAALKPTMAMLSSVAKKLYPDSKEDQAAIVAQWSREEQGKEFGVHTKGGPA